MKITVVSIQDLEVAVIETMVINPQTPDEIDSILRDYHVSRISDAQADKMVKDGALDLRQK